MGIARILPACLLGAALAAAPGAAAAERAPDPGPGYVPGEVVVRFKPGVSGSERSRVRARHDVEVEDVLRVPRVQVVKVEPGTSVEDAVAGLDRERAVEYAEPNGIARVQSVPNDPLYGALWGLPKIAAPSAWDLTTGASDVVVGVVDTGIAPDHPDLAAQLVPGKDFVHDDDQPGDLDGHGTHVAGTIGAVGNNGLGVTGVSQEVGLMALRALDHTGSGTWADVAEAFDYAGDNGVRVVNASIGGGYSNTVRLAVQNAPDTLFVVAAGNDGVDVDAPGNDAYPCELDLANVLCVAASDSSDARASFSNWGATSVDIAAPGVGVQSTYPGVTRPLDERFESGLALWDAGTWGTEAAAASEGSLGLADSPGGSYANDSDSAVRTASPVAIGNNCQLVFDLKLDVANSGDRFFVEASTAAGGPWTELYERSSDTSGFETLALDLRGPAGAYDFYGSSAYLRFRLQTDGSQVADGAALDWVEVTCHGGEAYASLSGTSMATPHVAGAAALLLSYAPALTAAELKSVLLSSGDPLSWSEPTVSGRRLDVAAALAAVAGLDAQGGAPEPSPAPQPSSPAPASGGSAGSGSDSSASGDDRKAPEVGVKLERSQRLRSLRHSGLRARVACDEACSVGGRLYARTAPGRRVLVGRGTRATRRAGSATLVVRLSRRGRSILAGGNRRQGLTLSLSAADARGNRVRLSRRVSLLR